MASIAVTVKTILSPEDSKSFSKKLFPKLAPAAAAISNLKVYFVGARVACTELIGIHRSYRRVTN